MDSLIAPRVPPSLHLRDKVFHLKTQIESIEDAPGHSSVLATDTSGGADLIIESDAVPQDAVLQKRAAEMQMWWDEAIVRNMDLPDGYTKVAVLLVKWEDELDELKTRAEAEELDALLRDRFHFVTETVELNVASKPQQQMRTYMSAFIQKHDGPHNLLIVYYTGHGVYREDDKYLELIATSRPMVRRGFSQEARCNWNKIQDILLDDDVEADVLSVLDTCYSSNLAKGGKEETRTFELLSACAIDSTTAAPGDNSFTRALIDALKRLHGQYGEKGFTTFHLNQGIALDKRRHDTPPQLWSLKQHHGRHIHLAPLKPQQTRELKARRLHPLPRGYLTLRFALRDESLTQEQIEFLTLQLSKAFNNKLLVGLSRIDWLGIKPARTTYFGRAALAFFAIAQWKRVCDRQRKRRLDEVGLPVHPTTDQSLTATPRKRSRDSFTNSPTPERKRVYLDASQPPSPPVSNSSGA
ncbi:hypothetical protein P171DRAFT_361646 [Karstenula rhodostoma CBS 690.94]|uniref:Peptidase C14 caspase domain-containing protein n=1 Tax=Karstenula rhodostoma CBS 690.94 TaxID=1392251 RepID=A0A9P4UCC8_9PLEO|nr:hypothetical protein P171DRAFT_361646 [Karstenula rhodostoma CBS 690.94]